MDRQLGCRIQIPPAATWRFHIISGLSVEARIQIDDLTSGQWYRHLPYCKYGHHELDSTNPGRSSQFERLCRNRRSRGGLR